MQYTSFLRLTGRRSRHGRLEAAAPTRCSEYIHQNMQVVKSRVWGRKTQTQKGKLKKASRWISASGVFRGRSMEPSWTWHGYKSGLMYTPSWERANTLRKRLNTTVAARLLQSAPVYQLLPGSTSPSLFPLEDSLANEIVTGGQGLNNSHNSHLQGDFLNEHRWKKRQQDTCKQDAISR